MRLSVLLAASLFASALIFAQQPKPTTAAEAPMRDTSYIDADGTAHVTRVVPLPPTISPEAQKVLARQQPDQGPPQSLEERRRTKRGDVRQCRRRRWGLSSRMGVSAAVVGLGCCAKMSAEANNDAARRTLCLMDLSFKRTISGAQGHGRRKNLFTISERRRRSRRRIQCYRARLPAQ